MIIVENEIYRILLSIFYVQYAILYVLGIWILSEYNNTRSMITPQMLRVFLIAYIMELLHVSLVRDAEISR